MQINAQGYKVILYKSSILESGPKQQPGDARHNKATKQKSVEDRDIAKKLTELKTEGVKQFLIVDKQETKTNFLKESNPYSKVFNKQDIIIFNKTLGSNPTSFLKMNNLISDEEEKSIAYISPPSKQIVRFKKVQLISISDKKELLTYLNSIVVSKPSRTKVDKVKVVSAIILKGLLGLLGLLAIANLIINCVFPTRIHNMGISKKMAVTSVIISVVIIISLIYLSRYICLDRISQEVTLPFSASSKSTLKDNEVLQTKQSSDSEATSKPQSNDMSSSSTQELVVDCKEHMTKPSDSEATSKPQSKSI